MIVFNFDLKLILSIQNIGHHIIFFTGVVMSEYGAKSNYRRKMVSKMILGAKMESLLHSECTEIIQNLKAHCQKNSGKAFDIARQMSLYSFNVIWMTLFSKRVQSTDETIFKDMMKLSEQMLKGLKLINVSEGFPFLSYLPFDFLKILKEFASKRQEIIGKLIDQRSSSAHRGQYNDFLDVLLQEVDKTDNEQKEKTITKENIIVLLFDTFITGSETVATVLSWMFLYLTKNPDIQEKCRNEIMSVVGEREVSSKDMINMPYMRAVIAETQRIGSVAGAGIPHSNKKDVDIGNYTIPAKSVIFFNIHGIHHDEKLFPKPCEFYPERFLDSEGQYRQKVPGYMPFLEGRRKCVGERLATSEIFVMAANVLKTFRISRSEGEILSTKPIYNTVNCPQPYKVDLTSTLCS